MGRFGEILHQIVDRHGFCVVLHGKRLRPRKCEEAPRGVEIGAGLFEAPARFWLKGPLDLDRPSLAVGQNE